MDSYFLRIFIGALLAISMMIITIQDWKYFRIPNYITFPLIPIGLLSSGYYSGGKYQGLFDPTHFIAMSVAGAIFFFIRYIYMAIKDTEGLGFGDVKFIAAIGAWVGICGVNYVVLISSVAAIIWSLIYKNNSPKNIFKTRMPYGSFLAPTTFIIWLLNENQYYDCI